MWVEFLAGVLAGGAAGFGFAYGYGFDKGRDSVPKSCAHKSLEISQLKLVDINSKIRVHGPVLPTLNADVTVFGQRFTFEAKCEGCTNVWGPGPLSVSHDPVTLLKIEDGQVVMPGGKS